MKKILIFILSLSNCFFANAQFKGGSGDGFAGSPMYSQSFINVYTGGKSDGFSTAFYNQVFTPLPIKIIYFNAKKEADFAKLEWKTSTEINASHFEVENSLDAKSFEKIGRVKADKSEKYDFFDNSSVIRLRTSLNSSLIYYRLKLVDIDEKFNYSKIISLENTGNEVFVGNFYPNPAIENKASIVINNAEKTQWIISKIDLLGKVLKTDKQTLEKGLNTLQFENFQKGLNIFQFESNGKIVVRKLLK